MPNPNLLFLSPKKKNKKYEKYKLLGIYGKKYLWEYHHNNREIHLDIISTEAQNTFYFKISIWSLVEDIENSVFGPNGYLSKLINDNKLQENFERAWKDIFE